MTTLVNTLAVFSVLYVVFGVLVSSASLVLVWAMLYDHRDEYEIDWHGVLGIAVLWPIFLYSVLENVFKGHINLFTKKGRKKFIEELLEIVSE